MTILRLSRWYHPRLARDRGAKTVDLTSDRSREAAHRLYEKVGFHVRETSVYRYGAKPGA